MRQGIAGRVGAISGNLCVCCRSQLMASHVMLCRGPARLGEPFNGEWLKPIIKSRETNEFQSAAWLARRRGGAQGAKVIAECVDYSDPAADSYYNSTLVWQIASCGGPRLKYSYDRDAVGTPSRVEENRKTLAALKEWLDSGGVADEERARADQEYLKDRARRDARARAAD